MTLSVDLRTLFVLILGESAKNVVTHINFPDRRNLPFANNQDQGTVPNVLFTTASIAHLFNKTSGRLILL